MALFLDMRKPDSATVLDLAVRFLAVAALFQIGRRRAGHRRQHAARVAGHPRADDLRGASAIGSSGSASGIWLAFGADWQGVGIWIGLALGLGVVAVLMIGRWMMRVRLGLTPPGAPELKCSAVGVDGCAAHNHMPAIAGTLTVRVPSAC